MVEMILREDISAYLEESEYINWKHHSIMAKATEFKMAATDEVSLVKCIYEHVRDEIKHSWDAKDKRVTKSASEVLEQKVGICWAKSNLLAALLRACDIPTGICYQRLTLGDTPETGYCIHALNAVYLRTLDKWIRLDARGNKEGVNAQFSTDVEILAFPVRKEMGEVDYDGVYARPLPHLMQVLESHTDALDMYLHALPDTIYTYRRAMIDDLEELVRTRIVVLRAANRLPDDTDMSVVEAASRAEYPKALANGEHVAYLVYDGDTWIGAGGVSFYKIMPTYSNPSGRKAYIMNMYTVPEYRRQGVAYKTLDLLVNEARKRGVTQISLEATAVGRKLYEKYGFVAMKDEMELPVF
ncbi:MAG: GNAT family N-acetyltransferase [Lachnospira sp.]|nr:GNAT family N-acetyltransferase [Lachnospira sp.]